MASSTLQKCSYCQYLKKYVTDNSIYLTVQQYFDIDLSENNGDKEVIV